MPLGIGAGLLAGAGQGLADVVQQEQQRRRQQLEQLAILQQLKNAQDQNQAAGLAFGAAQNTPLADVSAGGGMGGSPSSMPGPMPAASAPPRLADTVKRFESGGNYNVGYGGADLFSAPHDSSGFPIWPGKQGPSGISHAAGAYQFEPATWRTEAAKAGVKDFSPASQDKVFAQTVSDQGMKPWVPFNPNLRKALGGAQIPAETHQEVDQTARQVGSSIPPMAQGRVTLNALAQQIEKANPNADPAVKMMALERLHKLLAPSEQQQFQMMLLQNRQDLQLALKDMQIAATAARQDERLAASEEKGWQVQQLPGDQGMVRVNPNTGEVQPLNLPAGTTRQSSAAQSPVAPQARSLMAEGIANYQLPPLSGFALKSPEGQRTMAEVMKLNPQYDATQYTGKQAGARAVGTRSSTLAMATNVAEEQIPLVQATSERIDRTQYPTINSLVLAAEKGTGGEDVVRFMEQINTLKYVYARALNPTGVARVADLERFDNIINEAWSKGQIRAALDQMRQSLAAERRGIDKSTQGGSRQPAQKYTIGQVIDTPKGKVRVTGGDLGGDDPEVEPVE